MEPAGHRRYTEAEYLALEDPHARKHELIHGQLYAMAGPSPQHVLIAGNISRALHQGLRATGRRCLVLQSDQRLHVVATGMFTYPDVTVVCDRPQFHGTDAKSLTNPLVLVEVLSDSTEKYDRGAKFAHYRTISSLEEVLLVSQAEHRIEHYRRLETGQWVLTERTEGRLPMPALGIELAVDEVYVDLELLGAAGAQQPRPE